MVKEYIIKCNKCKNEIVKKIDIEACKKLGIEIKDSICYEKCIICGEKTYHTTIREYENDEGEYQDEQLHM